MTRIETQLKDFAKASLYLFWQRQMTFAGATVLAAYYVNLHVALFCYSICQFSEFFDYHIARRVLKWDGQDQSRAGHFLNLLTISSVFTSVSVVQYIVMVALVEGPSTHIGPLFFLFAAALYAAMNNCQLPRVLITRMTIYTAVFIFIPAYDIWLVRPPINSELWKQLGIVLFVLYFVIECSRSFLRHYKTAHIQLEELRFERDKVAKAFEMQSQFVSVVSHELRTPLTSVKGSLDLLNSGKFGELPEKGKHIAEIAKRNTNRLAVLIDDLLDFQKLKAGKPDFNFKHVGLELLVQEAVEINQAYGVKCDVSIRVFGADSTLVVDGDSSSLTRAMVNILSNAIKFSKSGSVVDVSLEKHGSKARVLFRDYGIGIPEDARELVFRPFSQVDSTDKRDFGGTGLGMSITKQIVEAHNGTVEYISDLGKGTTFVIELDLVDALEVTAPDGSPARVEEPTLSFAG